MSSIPTIILLVTQFVFSYPTETNKMLEVQIKIKHHFGESELKLDEQYTTFTGTKVSLTRLKYYISNIQLVRTDGTVWKEEKSYHLIEMNEESTDIFQISLKALPEGNYSKLYFSIGIDSLANHTGDQEGALNPDYGMFWMWETGYTFFKVEGYYQMETGKRGAMVYHIGRDECYRKVSLDIPPKRQSLSDVNCTFDITADVKKVFGGFAGSAIDLTINHDKPSISIMGGPDAGRVASNFAKIFSF
jgi:hypothetical protein